MKSEINVFYLCPKFSVLSQVHIYYCCTSVPLDERILQKHLFPCPNCLAYYSGDLQSSRTSGKAAKLH